jgi:Leucine-rich repeat (LRR) protein
MRYSLFFLVILFLSCLSVEAQSVPENTDSTFTELNKALDHPKMVKRLNLADQDVKLSDAVLKKFSNLEYLSLKNDHLLEVPHGLVYLKKLKVLDLSGNDINELPSFMKRLRNLREVYLNNETNLDLNQAISVLDRLPKLTSLHLENDGLETIPTNVFKLRNLEKLYLNNNSIKELPRNIKFPENLKFIDLQMNEIGRQIDKENRFGKGLIIKF